MADALLVVDQSTVDAMRYMFRVTVESGTATRADVPGYSVGGKTGTAEKVENGRYVSGKRFMGLSPLSPRMIRSMWCLVILDVAPAGTGGNRCYGRPQYGPGWGQYHPPVGRTALACSPIRSRQ